MTNGLPYDHIYHVSAVKRVVLGVGDAKEKMVGQDRIWEGQLGSEDEESGGWPLSDSGDLISKTQIGSEDTRGWIWYGGTTEKRKACWRKGDGWQKHNWRRLQKFGEGKEKTSKLTEQLWARRMNETADDLPTNHGVVIVFSLLVKFQFRQVA